jgi:microcystin-dependent protein
VVTAGDGIQVTGTGIPTNPYTVTSTVADIETGFDVQYNNTDVVHDVHRLDFRGTAVTVTSGTDEAVVTVSVPDPTTGAIIPTGAIWMFGMTTPPAGWLLCDGRTDLLIATYSNLFAAIGTNFGGNGTTTFGVPQLMDRFPVGVSATKPINGVPGGSATKTIGIPNLPPHVHSIAHNHGAKATSSDGSHDHNLELSEATGTAASVRRGTTASSPGAGPVKNNGGHTHTLDLGNFTGNSGNGAGTGTPLDILPPWQALAFMIKT